MRKCSKLILSRAYSFDYVLFVRNQVKIFGNYWFLTSKITFVIFLLEKMSHRLKKKKSVTTPLC